MHVICELLYIVYRQQWIIKKFLTQFFLGRLWQRFLNPSAPPLPIPASLEVPSVAAEGASLGASGFGSLDVPGVSAFGGLAVEFLINPITGDSGADRVVVSGLLFIQLRKS